MSGKLIFHYVVYYLFYLYKLNTYSLIALHVAASWWRKCVQRCTTCNLQSCQCFCPLFYFLV